MNAMTPTSSAPAQDSSMLLYYLRLGFRSLRRNPVLTLLMVMAIGFGVASSMTTFAVFRAVSGNPLPEKSSQLFVPQIDTWGPRAAARNNKFPAALSYTDAAALLRDHKAERQTMIYPLSYSLVPQEANADPITFAGYAATSDFFPMFNVPFHYGAGWNTQADDARANVVVISDAMNQKIFAGANSVGRTINLEGHDYRVVGVAAPWNPHPRFYDVENGNGYGDSPDIFVPFTRAVDLQTKTDGTTNCFGSAGRAGGWDSFLHSDCIWISYWAQLSDAAAVERYKTYLQQYAAEQQRAGRFNWMPRVQLSDLMQWLDIERVVPPETKVSLVISLSFLLVCLVNTVGLMLAKFMRRSAEIGVRRALGASRAQIYLQFLAEALIVGLAGGAIGLLLTVAGVLSVGLVFEPDIARLAHVDVSLVALTMLISLLATVVAALYPTWRAARIQPAWQLKSN